MTDEFTRMIDAMDRARRRAQTRPSITADRDIHRWIVRYRGHIYPFATWRRAITAASDPDHLCRYTCICPVVARRAS